MILIPLFAAALSLYAPLSHAQCPPDSWRAPQQRHANSDLEPSDYDWLKERRYSKQKLVLDLSSIITKHDMNIISNAAWNIITVELTSSSARPLDKEHNKLIKDRSTESGYRFATKTKPPPLKGFITWCLKDWLVKSEDTIEVTAEYQMRNNERPRLARRLIFIREGNRWLFDQVKDISNSLLED